MSELVKYKVQHYDVNVILYDRESREEVEKTLSFAKKPKKRDVMKQMTAYSQAMNAIILEILPPEKIVTVYAMTEEKFLENAEIYHE